MPVNTKTAEFVCMTSVPLYELESDIYPVMQNGVEILHVHTEPGIYEVLSKMGAPLYTVGDVIEVTDFDGKSVTIFNAENDEETQMFTIPYEQFLKDFRVVKDISV